MASTYEPIATTTLGSAVSSVTFNSISGYTDIKAVYTGTVSAADWVAMRFNGDTGSNYSATRLQGDGSSASSDRVSNYTYAILSSGNVMYQTQIEANIQNYANTTTYKTVINRSTIPADRTGAIVNTWRSTAAITSITFLTTTAATFAAGSTFTLYGIKAA